MPAWEPIASPSATSPRLAVRAGAYEEQRADEDADGDVAPLELFFELDLREAIEHLDAHEHDDDAQHGVQHVHTHDSQLHGASLGVSARTLAAAVGLRAVTRLSVTGGRATVVAQAASRPLPKLACAGHVAMTAGG